jgi:hypothetical protein
MGQYKHLSDLGRLGFRAAARVPARPALRQDEVRTTGGWIASLPHSIASLPHCPINSHLSQGLAPAADSEGVRVESLHQEIAKLSNDVVIEGHTDSAQYANGAKYGNWDLSSDRADAARRVMQNEGLRAGQVWAVRGFADNDKRVPEQPLDARNRRVSIVVRSASAAALESSVRAHPAPAR